MKHPLEDLFGMDEGTTRSQQTGVEFDIEKEYAMTEQSQSLDAVPAGPPADIKDEDDIANDKKMDEIYGAAMETFQNQIAYTEIIEPRYAARNAEVAANFLSIALQAAASKAKTKNDRKRANAPFIPFANGGKTTNNLIVADRNDILKMINIDQNLKEVK